MAAFDRMRRRQAEAVAPYVEAGEEVRATFLGQTPIPTWVFLLIAPYVFIFIQKFRLVAATDRNVYVMENNWMRSYKFKGIAYKVPLQAVHVESGGTWISIDGGPKLHGALFGPLKRGMQELVEYIQSAASQPLAAGAASALAATSSPAATSAPEATADVPGTPSSAEMEEPR